MRPQHNRIELGEEVARLSKGDFELGNRWKLLILMVSMCMACKFQTYDKTVDGKTC